MVKAELSYNPYLLETNIKFNGQAPRINSLVEKYQQETLQNWMKKIPAIFYDEMNGYDFELEFSGTRLEFNDLENAFVEAGVTNEMVRLFHKNELDCRKAKTDKIDELLKWLKKNPNRKFDFTVFMENNEELFSSDYACVMLNGNALAPEAFLEYKVSLEIIEDVSELSNTELLHTPIIIWLDEYTLSKMKSNLRYFLNRKDVTPNQLFFMVQPPLNEVSIERTIRDLGIEKPQLISAVEDDKIKRYFETYPVTDYIYEVIKVLRKEETEISKVLGQENEESMITNREIHLQIDTLEDIIKRLKASLELFINRDNFDVSSEMQGAKEHFIYAIQNWKNKKTKTTKESEANYLAQDLEQQLHKFYREFCQKIESIFNDTQVAIEFDYRNRYEGANYEMEYIPGITSVKSSDYKMLPGIVKELLAMKEERHVMPKEDLFGMLFKSSSEKEIVPVLETTFYCQQWRDYVVSIIEPLMDALIWENKEILKEYSRELAELYIKQLERLIKEQTSVKESVSAQLSDDELKLQIDNDWLVCFQDQLRAIERG